MRQALRSGQWEAGLSHYGGTFLDGLNLDLGSDLEEWVFDTREALAAQAQAALLTLARQASEDRDLAGAAALAERCHTLPGASPLEEAELTEVYTLLARAGHAHAETVRREARELGLNLSLPAPLPSDTPPKFHLLLALTDHLPAIRTALKVSAAELTRLRLAREQAGEAAHVEAMAWLDTHPLETPLLHLEVAQHLPVDKAWPYFDASRELWEEDDAEAVAKAAHHFAQAELKGGYPARAARVLEGVKQTDEVKLLRAWALIHSGRMPEAFTVVKNVPESLDVLTIRATVLAKEGKNEEAEKLIEQFPKNGSIYQAYAEMIAGHVARRTSSLKKAKQLYQKAFYLWQLHDIEPEATITGALLATTQVFLGEDIQTAFGKLLNNNGSNPFLSANVYNNYAHCCQHFGLRDTANRYFELAFQAFLKAGDKQGASISLNNIGMSHHLRGDLIKAETYYTNSLNLSSQTGDIILMGTVASNLSEVTGNADKLSDALSLLENSGHQVMADIIRGNLLPNSNQTVGVK